jgi:hypothetical protein
MVSSSLPYFVSLVPTVVKKEVHWPPEIELEKSKDEVSKPPSSTTQFEKSGEDQSAGIDSPPARGPSPPILGSCWIVLYVVVA